MSRHNIIIKKWLPLETDDASRVFVQCAELKKKSHVVLEMLGNVLQELKDNNGSKVRKNTIDSDGLVLILTSILDILEMTKNEFNKIFFSLKIKTSSILKSKVKLWRSSILNIKLKITYFLQQLITDVTPLFIYYGEKLLLITFKLANIYNLMLQLDVKYNLSNTMAISCNSCPYLLFPIRKMSITRFLQILSKRRAELCCHKLIDCLLESYKLYETHEDDSHSDNSSVEIFRALTNHMTPPPEDAEDVQEVITTEKCENSVDGNGHFFNLDKLLEYEEQNVLDLLNVALKISPLMLGHDGIEKSKSDGSSKISSKAKEKVLDYYQEILWGEVGNYLEHVILWWGPSPLASRPPHSSQHLREWIAQFTPLADVPPFIISTLTSLADGLGVHVTSTSWDKHFRLALVDSKRNKFNETGQLFCDMLQDLVSLSNQCEVTTDWIVGAPLDELPLVEQIPVLHRLDHSVHTTRLWAANETKKLANAWNVSSFFMITHCDIVNCLSQLNNVRLNDHTIEIEKGGLGVHVEVCAKMREKLVSEIKTNIQKLKETSKECVECLAAVCTTISLANLQMIFPKINHWNKSGNGRPQVQSSYVYKFLDQILSPVLLATEDQIICNMILKLMCEAWLDHIYINKIKFSENGALQLLIDFASVGNWIGDSPLIKEPIRKKMLKNEVLRRCEGVGRLLLRNPGEKIKMNEKFKDQNETESEGGELMPAEMYVPNQEQWLELRANKKKLGLGLQPLCCGD